ncbi:hypothetical protein ACFLSW_02300 [Candidatus Bipolaricaulota bacterium]
MRIRRISLGLLVVLGIGLCALMVEAQSWAHSYFSDWTDLRCESVLRTSDEGFILVGSIARSTVLALPRQMLIMKTDDNGRLVWQGSYPEHPFGFLTHGTCIQEVEEGYVVAGYSFDEGSFRSSTLVFKLGYDGQLIWQMLYRSEFYDTSPSSMATTLDGQVVIAGRIEPAAIVEEETLRELGGPLDEDFLVMKLDAANGSILWQRSFDHGYGEAATSIARSNGSRLIVAGNYKGALDDGDIWILELNEDGGIAGQKNFAGNGEDNVTSIITAADREFVIAGSTDSEGTGPIGVLSVKFTLAPLQPFTWARAYDAVRSQNLGYAVCETSNNDLVIAGAHSTGTYWRPGIFGSGSIAYSWDGLIFMLNPDGQPLWTFTYGGDQDDEFRSVESASGGMAYRDIVVGGYNESFPSPALSGKKVYAMNLRSNGRIDGDDSCMLHGVDIAARNLDLLCPCMPAEDRKLALEPIDLRFGFGRLELQSMRLCEDLP